MKNSRSLASKIVSLRKSKGLSQEKLAEDASINLRTLQRIESSKTEPRGQTLQLIAQALEVPFDYFSDYIEEEGKDFLQFMNLSALSFWVLPLGNIIFPLVLWYIKKDKIKGVREMGSKIINYQITWSFATFGFALLGILYAMIQPAGLPLYMLLLPAILVLCVINSVLILITTFQVKAGKKVSIPLGLKILR